MAENFTTFEESKLYNIGIPKKNASRNDPEFTWYKPFNGQTLIKSLKIKTVSDLIKNEKLNLDHKKNYWVYEVVNGKLRYLTEFSPNFPPPPKAKTVKRTVYLGDNLDNTENAVSPQLPQYFPQTVIQTNSDSKHLQLHVKILNEQIEELKKLNEKLIVEKNNEIERISNMLSESFENERVALAQSSGMLEERIHQLEETIKTLQTQNMSLQSELLKEQSAHATFRQRVKDKEQMFKEQMQIQSRIDKRAQQIMEKAPSASQGMDGIPWGTIGLELVRGLIGKVTDSGIAQPVHTMNGVNAQPKPQPVPVPMSVDVPKMDPPRRGEA